MIMTKMIIAPTIRHMGPFGQCHLAGMGCSWNYGSLITFLEVTFWPLSLEILRNTDFLRYNLFWIANEQAQTNAFKLYIIAYFTYNSRPMPDCLKPPKGVWYASTPKQLILKNSNKLYGIRYHIDKVYLFLRFIPHITIDQDLLNKSPSHQKQQHENIVRLNTFPIQLS